MKNKEKIFIIILTVVILAVLFIPIKSGPFRSEHELYVYSAIAYKVVIYSITDEEMLERVLPDSSSYEIGDYYPCVYLFPHNLRNTADLFYLTW